MFKLADFTLYFAVDVVAVGEKESLMAIGSKTRSLLIPRISAYLQKIYNGEFSFHDPTRRRNFATTIFRCVRQTMLANV